MDASDLSLKVPANQFFVEMEMINIDDTQYKTTTIKSYEEIFNTEACVHRVGLYAPAGCGKTCLCQMIPYHWAKDGTLGDKFELVVFLRLRGRTLHDDVAGIIAHDVVLEEKRTVGELIKKYHGKILFVLDGYDELLETTTPAQEGAYTLRKLLFDSLQHILISTRPTQLSEMKKNVSINMKVRIKGLSEEHAKEFIKNYCKHRNITSNTSQPIEDVIIDQLKKKNLISMSKNPQQLQLVCDYKRDHTEISGCLCKLYHNMYTENCDAFLRRVQEDTMCDAEVKKALLDDTKYNKLLKNLQKLALEGFVEGKLLYDERRFLQLLGQEFVSVYDKLGTVYFEETIGGKRKVLGFRHKSFQEYFGALFLYPFLVQLTGNVPDVVIKVLEQWKNLKLAVQYERLFVFMAGMAENEEAATKILNHITEMMELLKAYYESESEINLQDTEDLPRQLILMQVKCALEIKAAGRCSNSKYVEDLLKAIPYTDDMPLPDINIELMEEEDISLQLEDSSADVRLPKKVKNIYLNVNNGSHQSIEMRPLKMESPLPKVNKNDVVFNKAYWIRILGEGEEVKARVDCLALPSSMLDTKLSFTDSRPSFFLSSIRKGVRKVLEKYSSVELVAADCSMKDVNHMCEVLQDYPQHRNMFHLNTCHAFTIHLNSVAKCEYINCNMDTQTTMTALKHIIETQHKPPFSTLCLQKWYDSGRETGDKLAQYCGGLEGLDVLRLEQCMWKFAFSNIWH